MNASNLTQFMKFGLMAFCLMVLLPSCSGVPQKQEIQRSSRVTIVERDRLKPIDPRLTQVHSHPAMQWPGASNEDLLIQLVAYMDLVKKYECQMHGIRGNSPEWCKSEE